MDSMKLPVCKFRLYEKICFPCPFNPRLHDFIMQQPQIWLFSCSPSEYVSKTHTFRHSCITFSYFASSFCPLSFRIPFCTPFGVHFALIVFINDRLPAFHLLLTSAWVLFNSTLLRLNICVSADLRVNKIKLMSGLKRWKIRERCAFD